LSAILFIIGAIGHFRCGLLRNKLTCSWSIGRTLCSKLNFSASDHFTCYTQLFII
jgi:hypothetical protein